ncbi:MAG TPA: CopG family transcriptional regulator [Candidatus Pullichristensenella stercorigallinarum]|uniref:CopG family transcriptional regulator n=1 Tax=Candidatus Pullichristensenella stercorigallinarum TaxID=2840909 RepID=A0A9D0ZMJ9_9FIRM|nr:CopG family transcriptional regulator [Candidatus Pullichristensenella stercorigallinarum]
MTRGNPIQTIRIDKATKDHLKELAAKRETSVAALIKEAISAWLERQE